MNRKRVSRTKDGILLSIGGTKFSDMLLTWDFLRDALRSHAANLVCEDEEDAVKFIKAFSGEHVPYKEAVVKDGAWSKGDYIKLNGDFWVVYDGKNLRS